jgi:Holliday junction resolvasome RuvABC endonuclease subunit
MTSISILGIDPSLTATGIALPDGTLRTIKYPKLVVKDARLQHLYNELDAAIKEHGVTHALMEDLPKHAQGAGITGMVQGVLRLAMINNNIPYTTVAPASVKKLATGKGNATKPDMRMAFFQRTGADNRDDNQVDAFWLREMALQHLGLSEHKLPKTHTDALAKVVWAEGFPAKAEA